MPPRLTTKHPLESHFATACGSTRECIRRWMELGETLVLNPPHSYKSWCGATLQHYITNINITKHGNPWKPQGNWLCSKMLGQTFIINVHLLPKFSCTTQLYPKNGHRTLLQQFFKKFSCIWACFLRAFSLHICGTVLFIPVCQKEDEQNEIMKL